MNGEKICGFTVTRTRELPELDAVLYQMTHDKTGLELVWLKREEENKTFGIAFETLPWDDTGVFHILEHSVLCGSERYPVKEPFVELMKSSMNTFLNAMTFPDKTFYPISSRNDKDFVNLMRVYLDAVFRPLIYTKPEIFYQEGWHYELDEKGSASYKGVVFNEMKGAFASADELVEAEMNRILFPGSPYRFVSGGDPAVIPDLTYEAFLDSHRRFYAPSNAYVYLDGDLDIEKVLSILHNEYLCHYDKTERFAPPAMQAAVRGEAEGLYELAPGEDLDGKTRLSFGKVIGTFADREKLVAMQVLAEVLCGTNQSPLSRAILSAGLAEEVNMGVNDGVLQPWLLLDMKNIREESLAEAEKTAAATLRALAENGLDHEQLKAVMANVEFKLRERDYGRYPQGLVFGFQVLESWLYGGAPEANLEVGDLFVSLERKMQAGYFEQLIREVLLDSPHSAKVVLRPSHTAGEARRAAEQARLDRETALWTENERASIAAKQEKLLAWQNSVDTPEALATIPQLALADIPAQPEPIPTDEMTLCGIPALVHSLRTGGIVYVSLYFDADGCTEEELSCLAFACALLGEADTRVHRAEENINRFRLLCGGFDAYPMVFTNAKDPGSMTVKLCVEFSALESNLPAALELVGEVLLQSVFSEETAHDILRQAKMESFQRIVMAGNSVALGRVAAQFWSAGVAEECVSGVSYYEWLKKQEESWDFEKLSAGMTAVLAGVVNRNGMTISVAGTDDERMVALADTLAKTIPAKPLRPKAPIRPWGKRQEGIAIPADVAFAVTGGDMKEYGGAFSGQMLLAAQIIRLGYLWNVVRVQGGAYGTGMTVQDTGFTACYSYRDPNGAGSVEAYRRCGAFLRNFTAETEDLTGFIIGTVAENSPLMTPKMKAMTGDRLYFSKTTWADRCRTRLQLLRALPEDLTAIAGILEKTLENGGICIVGGREQLARCADLERIITL